MSMADIRDGLEAMLESVDSIRSASGYPVEQVNAVPAAFVGFDDDDIRMANVQQDFHALPVTVLVQRKAGNLRNQMIAVEAVIEDLTAVIRANQTLGLPNLVNMVRYTRAREGVYEMGQVPYVGFILDLTIKTTQEVSFKDAG